MPPFLEEALQAAGVLGRLAALAVVEENVGLRLARHEPFELFFAFYHFRMGNQEF